MTINIFMILENIICKVNFLFEKLLYFIQNFIFI